MIEVFEEKDYIGSTKDVSLADLTITGYLAHFGSVDLGNDVIEQGAFTKTLQTKSDRLRFLNYHNFQQPHNKFTVLKEDSTGLYFEVKMVKDVSYSMDTIRLYDAGVLTEQSIGFNAVKKFNKGGIRHLQEVMLGEGSNVVIAMNPNAKFGGFKSFTLEKCNDHAKNILNFLRTGSVTDETFIQLEIGLKQLQAYSYELGKQALKPEGEPDDTQTKAEPQIIETIKSFRNSLSN